MLLTWRSIENESILYYGIHLPHFDVAPIYLYGGESMRYTFKVSEDGKERVEKEAMSFKKLKKSLLNINPKWSGIIGYKNKKDRWVNHCFTNGKKV